MQQTEFYDPSGQAPDNPWVGSQVKIETFANPGFSGTPAVSAARRIALFRSEEWTPPARERHSIRYTMQYMPAKTEGYLFLVGAGGADAYKLIIDGKTVLDQPSHEGQAPRYVEVPLTVGKTAAIELDYWPDAAYPRIGLGVRGVSELVTPETTKIASAADAVVVAVGFDSTTESEGYDRSFELPFGQDQLIQVVSQANPHTIVSITAGGNVDMHRWLSGVPALLHNWYPGQEGGHALADILTGQRSPEGHLPVSFEPSWEENPVHDNYYAAPVPKGQTPHVAYKEGVFVGYRYYTSFQKKPLFPFGFGLSYTTFTFSNLKVSPDQPTADGNITVSFDVTNTGHQEGATVAQIYVGDPSAKVKRPVKELRGFEKVRLGPGDTHHVSVALNSRALTYWSTDKNGWQVDPGKFVVFVGDSSENTPLTQDFQVQ
jgi:beta-glucosidase